MVAKSVLDPEHLNTVVRDLCELKRKGATNEEATQGVGINRTTLHRWLRLGREGKEPYVQIAVAFWSARRDCVDARIAELLAS